MNYTAEDEKIIKEHWDDLLLSCTKICRNDEDWNFIKRAFFLAKEAHKGVRRRSGEPSMLHPIAVAKIVIDEIGLAEHLSPTRSNGLLAMVKQMRLYALAFKNKQ